MLANALVLASESCKALITWDCAISTRRFLSGAIYFSSPYFLTKSIVASSVFGTKRSLNQELYKYIGVVIPLYFRALSATFKALSPKVCLPSFSRCRLSTSARLLFRIKSSEVVLFVLSQKLRISSCTPLDGRVSVNLLFKFTNCPAALSNASPSDKAADFMLFRFTVTFLLVSPILSPSGLLKSPLENIKIPIAIAT